MKNYHLNLKFRVTTRKFIHPLLNLNNVLSKSYDRIFPHKFSVGDKMKIMGFLDKLINVLGLKKKEVRILVLGLNNSGKSTLLNQLKNEDTKSASEVVPTVGFNVEKFKNQNVGFTAFDMSGQGRYRELWEHYYKDCEGIIFVIDSTDKLRLAVVKDELDLLIQNPEISSKCIPILFLANKKDLRDALSSIKIASSLHLERIQDKPWHICTTNALSGDGLQEGIQWLTQQLCEKVK